MTTLTYICTDKDGNTFEVKTYAEAEKVKVKAEPISAAMRRSAPIEVRTL